MKIVPEIEMNTDTKHSIQELRNSCFPEHQVARSYYKQLPHYRVLEYRDGSLVGYMGLDYRVIEVGGDVYSIIGVIDFCVSPQHQRKGIGSNMLDSLSSYVIAKDVDFIMLVAEKSGFYTRHGFQQVTAYSSWLRLHEHKNYGIAFEQIDDLFVKPVKNKKWPAGHVDWLGYMF